MMPVITTVHDGQSMIAPRSYTLHAVKNTDFWSCMNAQEQRLLNYGMDLVGMTGMCFHNRHI